VSFEWHGKADVGFHELDAATGLDPARLALFRRYLEQEYSGPFVHGMGSYEILDMVRTLLCPGRRLDVGGGTASLFWILAAPGDIRTTAADVEPEALVVLREFLTAPSPLPACYHQAAELFGIPPARVESLRRSIDSYLVFNALDTWPDDLRRAQYDSVTAFGCFAIGASVPAYRSCFENAGLAVRPAGRIVGADWIRHKHLQARDYSFVTARTLRGIGSDLGLRVLHLDEVTVHNDETYGGVVLWAFEKP
jgi:hypothetical protein